MNPRVDVRICLWGRYRDPADQNIHGDEQRNSHDTSVKGQPSALHLRCPVIIIIGVRGYSLSLLLRVGEMRGVHEFEEEDDCNGEKGCCTGEDYVEAMKGQVANGGLASLLCQVVRGTDCGSRATAVVE